MYFFVDVAGYQVNCKLRIELISRIEVECILLLFTAYLNTFIIVAGIRKAVIHFIAGIADCNIGNLAISCSIEFFPVIRMSCIWPHLTIPPVNLMAIELRTKLAIRPHERLLQGYTG